MTPSPTNTPLVIFKSTEESEGCEKLWCRPCYEYTAGVTNEINGEDVEFITLRRTSGCCSWGMKMEVNTLDEKFVGTIRYRGGFRYKIEVGGGGGRQDFDMEWRGEWGFCSTKGERSFTFSRNGEEDGGFDVSFNKWNPDTPKGELKFPTFARTAEEKIMVVAAVVNVTNGVKSEGGGAGG